MQIEINVFGIARDIIGKELLAFQLKGETTIAVLKKELNEQYPELLGLNHYFIAVNECYVEDDHVLQSSDIVVIIPPVSGG